MTTLLAGALLAGAPLQPGADEARRAAQQELAKGVYRDAEPGLLQRAWEALLDALSRVEGPSGGGVLQAVVVVLLVLGVLVVVALLVRRTGAATRRAAAGPQPGLTGPVDAAALRRDAREAAREQRWDDAVLVGFRALVRGLQERDLVGSAPGLTASEAAREAGRSLPALAGRLTAAADLFDSVLYGGRRARREDAEAVAALDDAAVAARPARRAEVAAGGAAR
ncbi:DUF4129 domain-containing protein [Streptomyces sp. NP160]|uniref:DUF4129 domain-containing protein n=1 Tax=Streptomyces sp. NP160 TaxID=2586637 RepID=UPI00111A7526|nr:DUF4129 domain-containing protein [Streptomyces sp. NP160]TNM68717.1 DUF4129 domain-containing protein [Streptomyces sp. NP160]